jgi:hypothetical protein
LNCAALGGAPGLCAQKICWPHEEHVQSLEFHIPPELMQACCCVGSQLTGKVQLQLFQFQLPPPLRQAACVLGSGHELMVEHCDGVRIETPRQNCRSLALLMLEQKEES